MLYLFYILLVEMVMLIVDLVVYELLKLRLFFLIKFFIQIIKIFVFIIHIKNMF